MVNDPPALAGIARALEESAAAVTADAAAIWPEVRARLRTSVSERAFRLYLAGLDPVACRDGLLVLAARPEACRWVQDRFGRVLDRALAEVAGTDLGGVRVVEAGTLGPGPPARPEGDSGRPQAPSPALGLGPSRHTFEHFVIGPGNRLAHAAALAVAEQPAQAYNPLVLCGPPGVGKTHLLGAIAHYVSRHGGGLSAGCVSAETFASDFRRSLSSGSMEGFKARYRSLDLLAIDDTHFFQRKPRTQEELSHTLAALAATGSQVVVASDRAPAELSGLDGCVREHLGRGLVCELATPDRPTRLGILRQRATHDGIALADPDVLKVLADEDTGDVRLLEGTLIRAVALASLAGRPLDANLAREALAGVRNRDVPTGDPVEAAQQATARAFGVTQDELLSRSRAVRLAWPRHVAMYLAREVSGQSLPDIGRRFGGRNHTTVLNAWRQTTERMGADPQARETVEDLRRSLGSHHDALA